MLDQRSQQSNSANAFMDASSRTVDSDWVSYEFLAHHLLRSLRRCCNSGDGN